MPKLVKERAAPVTGVQTPDQENFERDLPVAAILDEYLTSGRKQVSAWIGRDAVDERTGEKAFNASGAGCLREEVLKKARYQGVPQPAISQRRFAIGNIVEKVLEEAFRWKGVLVDAQTRVWCDWAFRPGKGAKWVDKMFNNRPYRELDTTECLVSGILDGIVVWDRAWANIAGPIPADTVAKSETKKKYLVDWKTVHSKKFDYLKNGEVDEGYAMQVSWYAKMAHEQHGHNFDGVRLVYADKDAIRIFQQIIDPSVWIPMAEHRMRNQRAAWETFDGSKLTLPAGLQNFEGDPGWKCSPLYCSFAVALDVNGDPICKPVREYWKAWVANKLDKGKDAEYPGRALELSEGCKMELDKNIFDDVDEVPDLSSDVDVSTTAGGQVEIPEAVTASDGGK